MICDFAAPQGLTVVRQHYTGIIRYVSDYPWKNITGPEYQQALSLGLTVNLVCEQGQQPALRGSAGGQHDSYIANQQADALGFDGCMYYVAEDPNTLPQSSWSTVEAYFQALG